MRYADESIQLSRASIVLPANGKQAVPIDADNAQASVIAELMAEVSRDGTASVKKLSELVPKQDCLEVKEVNAADGSAGVQLPARAKP